MTQLSDLDREIAESRDRVLAAGRALLTFYEPTVGAFIRDTLATTGGAGTPPVIGKTSTSRAHLALLELYRLLVEYDRPAGHTVSETGALRDEVSTVVRALTDQHFAALTSDPGRVRESATNGVNMFTDAQVLLSSVLRQTTRPLTGVGGDIDEAVLRLWQETEQNLRAWEGGRITAGDQTHDFITLHAVRAGDALGLARAQPQQWWPELGVRIRRSILVQLGRQSAGITSQFDPAELAFSVALLHRFQLPDYRPLTDRSLVVIAEEQTDDGSWPTSRLISYGGPQQLFVASFEVALTLSELLISQLDRGEHGNVDALLGVLRKTLQLVDNTFMRVGDRAGWCNDRARSPGRLESWATAVVLLFLIRYHDALVRLRQERVLLGYEVTAGTRRDIPWPDLALSLGVLTAPDPGHLERISDPTDDGTLSVAIRRHFVEPIVTHPVQRPAATSLLLPGPPGTRKTSLVQLVAKALDWPLLTLTPSDFLRRGNRDFHDVALDDVLNDLMRLRRVVILLAQCEDALRRPRGAGSFGGRNLATGLLSRLNQLRRNQWVLIFAAPNETRDNLDPSATRADRFDFIQEMHNPPLTAQRRYFRSRMPQAAAQTVLERALSDYAGRVRANHDGARTEVTFALLDQLMSRIRADESLLERGQLPRLIEQLADPGPPPLPAGE
ncbi:AAA family ATPase [Actinoplanes sp. M2I2]|uniref:AAA family ATPase n=1 Tax=Actinoplanes sp. M2I2 TaxID=1734444 RepID=UPI00202075F0|nr:AAA family ATPase [Actinoplanes sp. M2I2]